MSGRARQAATEIADWAAVDGEGAVAVDQAAQIIQAAIDAEVAERVGVLRAALRRIEVEGHSAPHAPAKRLAEIASAALATAGAPGSQEDDFGAWCAQRREWLGRIVREVWVRWAKEQPDPKPSWLVPWDGLTEPEQEVDRRIGEAVAENALATYHRIKRGPGTHGGEGATG